MDNLRIAVKREYFEQILSGEKIEEFRIVNDYWTKRIVDRWYDTITITLGYPKKGDKSREITTDYRGYQMREITHNQFGDEPVLVYAIAVGRHP